MVIRARDLMSADFRTIERDAPLVSAIKLMRKRCLETGKVDVRCLVVLDEQNKPTYLLTEADLIHAILPWFFRERRFSDFVSKWVHSELPEAALVEMFEELAARARKKSVADIMTDRPLVWVDEDATLIRIAYTLYVEKIKTVPVLRDGQVVGMVFRASVFEAVAAKIHKTGDMEETQKSDE